MALSIYAANRLLDHVLRATASTPPANMYLALYEEDPTAAGTGVELTGGSYARQLCTWDVASGGITQNDAVITFNGLPAAEISHGALWDASSGGNMWIYGSFDDVISVGAGDSQDFDVAALVHTLV